MTGPTLFFSALEHKVILVGHKVTLGRITCPVDRLPAKSSVTQAMSFLRHWEIYRVRITLVRERQIARRSRAPLDEFPVAYSWRVALQHCPLPLRQSPRIVRETASSGKDFLSGQPNGRGVKDFHLPSQAANPLAGFEVTTEASRREDGIT
jgi:hypothetical protein